MKQAKRTVWQISTTVILLLLLTRLLFPTWTPSIQGEQSISSLEQVQINGAGHEVMIRGKDVRNPILIFVHGGPGCSEIPYVRKYQQLLEERFTIVHYDQRGSGKSYHFGEDYTKVSTDVLVDDLLALTDYTVRKLGQKKVLLIGHSFGTYIGMKAAAKSPERFTAYIGIGQVSDQVQSELDGWEYALKQAQLAGNNKDVSRLELLHDAIAGGLQLTPRELIRKYGGAARLIDDNMDYYTGFLLQPEYNGLDVIRFLRGVSVTQQPLLAEEAGQPIASIVKKLDIPCYFVMGQYDYMTSARAAKQYWDTLEAPKKGFVLFEQSAHYPQFEEKERFAQWLNQTWDELVR